MKPERSRLIPQRIGPGLSIFMFGVPALLLWAAIALFMPPLVRSGWATQTAWFLAGSVALMPLLAAALIGAFAATAQPSPARMLEHLRVRPMTAGDWRVAAYVFLLIGIATAALYAVNNTVWPRLSSHPPFLPPTALEPAQYYILLLWLPFFAVNIFGEELWWRGFILPRQEAVFGRFTWIVQGLLHTAFHFSLGLGVIFILWPTAFALPWAVQRSKNTSVGIVLHAAINGPAFLALNLGLMPA
jgi:membrane protease YdiL (CAAX protease family)